MPRGKNTDYRQTLLNQFELIRSRNPRFSLRAFARQLELNPATLSKILNEKRGLSHAMAMKISEKLGLDEDSREDFLTSVESLHARSPLARAAATTKKVRKQQADFIPLDATALEILQDWRHFAILELLSLPSPPTTKEEIAFKLRIDLDLIEKALGRLEQVGLLSLKDGRYRVLKGKTWGPDEVPSAVIRSYHREFLTRSQEALSDPMDERDFSSMILSVDPARLPEIKAYLRAIHKEFSAEFGSSTKRDSVMALNIQCFKLSRG
jgi:uncharacterized protein (TIGR02147 family)